ncbi:RNA polymerase sigma-70 factor [Chitinophaga caseinilytica]|uniref:RNA polymerase sigma-70 factor n=1 Tax=Chitinophaga caseinilytica TaxID=2267521 RepID=A0ABZ2YZV8_9BACT
MSERKEEIGRGLLQAVAEGDEKAFSEIFHHYRNKVYAIAFKVTGSEAIAEEVLLDVFLKVWLKREQLPQVTHFAAWLFTITRNHLFNLLKQTAHRTQPAPLADAEEYALYPASDNPAAILQEKEYRKVLQQAIDRLPPQQKKVYRLIKEHGLKREEAAVELNLSPETVKRHLSDAMQFIRVYCVSHLGTWAALTIVKGIL